MTDYHAWFRGVSKSFEADDTTIINKIKSLVTAYGVGESDDKDCLYLFESYRLTQRWEPIHSSVGYDDVEGTATEFRVFNVFDMDGRLLMPITFRFDREIEEGEIREDRL